MKKTIGFTLFTALFSAFFFSVSAQTGKDPEAKKVLDAMSKKYKATPSFKAEFVIEMLSAEEGAADKFEGKVWFKDSKYHLDLGDQEIFNNTATTWTYLKSENEVTIMDYEPNPEEINITNIHDLYESNFKYILLASSETPKANISIVDLNPEDKELSYFKIRLEIDTKTNELKSWKIFEKSGRQYQYSIKNFNSNVSFKDSEFEFNTGKYPNVVVVDLR